MPRLFITFQLLFCLSVSMVVADETAVDFQKEIRPILSQKCYKCHGPDEAAREADLRLDTFRGATEDRGGYKAITPGNHSQSELFARISSESDDDRMPPADSGLQLTPEEIQAIKKWIQQGAQYKQHWAFVEPALPELPMVSQTDWSRNPIDLFILAKLEKENLAPSPEADRNSLARRLYLDLTGLPPTIEQLDKFVNSSDPQAYEKLVDELLASPQYGERWARHWLDLARYADTNGYEKDRPRSIWPFRDWVINAINNDMPFDQFTIEQLAGDMLPDATTDQLIATGFHRNTMINEEGGIDPLEYRFYSMVDRVATTGTVWMGMTIGCAQCHTHKYDPITHTEYFAMMALLNNADEPDLFVHDDAIEKARKKTLDQITQLKTELASQFPPAEGEGSEEERRKRNLETKFAAWLKSRKELARHWQVITPARMTTNLPRLELLEDGSILSTGDITKRDVFDLKFDLASFTQPIKAIRLEVLPDERLPAQGPGRAYYEGRKGDFFLSEVTAKSGEQSISFHEASHTFGKISIGNGTAEAANVFDGDGSTGWSTSTEEGQPHHLVLNFQEPVQPQHLLELQMIFERHFAASLGRFRFSVSTEPGIAKAVRLPIDVIDSLAKLNGEPHEELKATLLDLFLEETPELAEARKPITKLQNQLASYPTTMILRERPEDNPRITHRHHRGEYLTPKEVVEPNLPAILSSSKSPPRNRLEFARWLVSEENPLVGRVTVNRYWQEIFGRGLVRTSEDFGTQSSYPTHPQLLDWLAVQFTDKGANGLNWSRKRLHRLIVTSATYRQRSTISADQLKKDPENLLLGRGARFRINAEMIRDLALQSSGLLSLKLGGPSVYPPQPATVYAAAYGSPKWPVSKGEDRYRRSLYTFSKRTAPFAAFTVFDAPTGENCIVRRDRSNTPLQALTLLNDEMFLDAARAIAQEELSEPKNDREIVSEMFLRILTRPPTEEEVTALVTFKKEQKERFESGALDPKQWTQLETATPELAAWMMTARVILNLDETVTKP